MTQLLFSFDDSAAVRNRRTNFDPDQLEMFAFSPNIDVHLHSPAEAVAQVSGPSPERTYQWLANVLGSTRELTSRRVAFPTSRLDRLIAVRPPATVTLDGGALSVARALWANAIGLSPLKVSRHRQRLIATSTRWPTGLGVTDAPWTAIATLLHLGVPLNIDPKARELMTEKLAQAGEHVATAWLAGSAVMIEASQPDLLEALQLRALSYAGPPKTGRYRLPLLAALPLLDEPSIKVPDDLAASIRKANAKTRPLSSMEGFPWDLYSFQARDAATALRILETSGGVLLAGSMGSGKSQPVSSTVYTPQGPKLIGDIVVGDQVLGSNGQANTVTGVFPQGIRPMYRVSFTDKNSVLVDGDHLWQVHTPSHKFADKSGDPYPPGRVLTTKELLESKLRTNQNNLRWYIPLITSPLEFTTETPKLPGYTLGALLGDGSLTTECVQLSDAHGQVVRLVEQDLSIAIPGMRTRLVGKMDYSVVDDTCSANRVMDVLGELGLLAKHSWEKYIPDEYKYAPVGVRKALLQGLLDTGGSVSYGERRSSIAFGSPSEQLIDDVGWLVESLGGLARKSGPRKTSYTYKGEKRFGRPRWRLSITLPSHVRPFRCARKADLYQPRTKYWPTRGILSIEPEGKTEAVCISVASPDALYVTEHAILTHNTLIALAIAHQMELWPMLVVCPLAAMSTWARELTTLGRSYYLATESSPLTWAAIGSGDHDAVVISYDRLHAFTEVIESRGFVAIIADEIQRVRTPNSRRSRALRSLAASVPVRIGLSGTPMQNRIEDLLAPASFLVPGEFRPRTTTKDLSDLYPGDPIEGIADHVGALMVRRRMQDTGVKLPNKTVRRLYVDLSADQRHALSTLESEAEVAKEDGALDRMHAFARLQKMRQIISCPSVANVGGVSPKVTAALDLVQEFTDLGRKCVVFCANRRTWTDLSQGLDALGIGHTGIWGSTPIKDRLSNERAFHNDPNVKVFIGTIQSCAESLTLSPTGTVVIHCDYVYNPSDLDQAEARVYRMNQTNAVDVIYLHARAPGGTLDDRMTEILDQKRALFAQVIDRTVHTDNTHISYSLGDLVYLLTGSRDAKIDQHAVDHADVLAREQALKRHAKVTIHKHKGKNKHSDDFFDDGSMALLLEDFGGDLDDLPSEDELAAMADEVSDVSEAVDFDADPQDNAPDVVTP